MDPLPPVACDHYVQFYDTDAHLVECLVNYIGTGLRRGETVVCIAGREHLAAIEEVLLTEGDLEGARAHGRYIAADAEATLAEFMVRGAPDPARFRATVAALLERPRAEQRPIRAFGEMVAILRERGRREAATALEDLWNTVLTEYGLTLYCAYPRKQFGAEGCPEYAHVCGQHSRILPADPAEARTLLAAG
jgi:hypothetical protein